MEITIHEPMMSAKRVKVFIPYGMVRERELLRTIPGKFYHKSQRFWSIPNWVYTHVMGVNSRRMRNPLDLLMGRTAPGR